MTLVALALDLVYNRKTGWYCALWDSIRPGSQCTEKTNFASIVVCDFEPLRTPTDA